MDNHSDAEVDSPSEPEEVDNHSNEDETDNHSDAEIDKSLAESFSLLGDTFQLLRMLKLLKKMKGPRVNPPCPFPKLTGAQWLHMTLSDHRRCLDNLRMSRDAFLHLHHILVAGFGLKSTS
jgi:hypothetical protein